MQHQHDRAPALRLLPEQPRKPDLMRGIEVGHRLVGQDDGGLCRQGAGDMGASALAAGQGGYAAAGETGHAGHRQRRRDGGTSRRRLGIVSAPEPGKPRRGMVAAMSALHAVPNYLVAQALVIALAVGAGLFPVQGLVDARAPGGFWDMAHHLVLPVVSLAMHHLTFIVLLTRARIGREMQMHYVTTAFAKGLTKHQVRVRHALPNALLPLTTLFGSRFGAFVAGSVVIETVFALPGLGRLAVSSAIGRDYPTIIGVVLVGCAAIVIANLIVDLLMHWLDPRTAEHWA